MKDFNSDNIKELSSELCGQEIDEIRIDDKGMDSFLEVVLLDGRILRIRYDWIHDFEIEEN